MAQIYPDQGNLEGGGFIKVHVLCIQCCALSVTVWGSRARGFLLFRAAPPQWPAGHGLYGGQVTRTAPAALKMRWKNGKTPMPEYKCNFINGSMDFLVLLNICQRSIL